MESCSFVYISPYTIADCLAGLGVRSANQYKLPLCVWLLLSSDVRFMGVIIIVIVLPLL